MMRVLLGVFVVLVTTAVDSEAQSRSRGYSRGRSSPSRGARSRSYSPRSYNTSRRSYSSRSYTPSRSYSRSRYTPRARTTYTRPTTRSRSRYIRPTTRSTRSRSTYTRPTTRSTRSRSTYTRPTTRSTRSRSTYTRPTSRRTPTARTSRTRSTYAPTTATRNNRNTTAMRNNNRVRTTPTARRSQNGFRSGNRTPTATARGGDVRARGGATRGGATRGSTFGARGRTSNAHQHTSRHSRYGYTTHSRHGHSGHRGHGHHGHSYYGHHGLHLSYSFGYGRYYGCNYYYPYYNYACATHYAFFYPARIAYCYAPYGFYYDTAPVYITTNNTSINDDYANTDYEDVELKPTEESGKDNIEPEPAAGSPTTEKFLREASEAFHKADYEEAAKKFRLAAIASPDNAGPLFALGQALIALGNDAYAARVIRKAVELEPTLVKEPGDIVGVYKDQAEFDAILKKLETRAEAAGGDALFLLGVQRYFTGDPRARTVFQALSVSLPKDTTVAAFKKAVDERFKAESELPEIGK